MHGNGADGMDLDVGAAGGVALAAAAPPVPMLEDGAWADELPAVAQQHGPRSSTAPRGGKGTGKGDGSGDKGRHAGVEIRQLRQLVGRLAKRMRQPMVPEHIPFGRE